MLNSVKGIQFRGAAFNEETSFKLFSLNEADRVSLIFGRNGSGKSTISRAVSKAIGNADIEDIDSVRFVDSSDSEVMLTDDEKNRVFVFNDDYTNRKVRLQEDGLNTIVMFGEIGDIADKMERVTAVLEKAEKGYADQSEKYALYMDVNNLQSPDNHYRKIKEKLKGDKSWAGRERIILGLKKNASVNDAIIEEIMRIGPAEPEVDLLDTYESEFSALQAAKSAGAIITAAIPTVPDYTERVKMIMELLAKKIEEPTLTNREKRLLALAQSGRQSMLTDIKAEFLSETNTCPFCLQAVTDEYKGDLIRSIEKVLNRSVEEHKAALEKSRIKLETMDLSALEPVDKTTFDLCRTAVGTVKDRIIECDQAIDQKIANLYTPITDFTPGLQKSADTLKAQLSALEEKKREYNNRIGSIQRIKKTLQTLNKKRAYYEIKDLYADYIKQNNEMKKAKIRLDQLFGELEKEQKELDDLNQQRKKVKIAADLINRGLQYVFFSEDRLKVIISGDNYRLLSNNKPVKPKSISVGERNILALCYFFTELLKNINERDIHKAESFIVLDDPVSSFDLENRVGIISYLKSQIAKILRGNPNSKILLLSHDLPTVFDLDTALGEIAKQVKKKQDKYKKIHRLLVLDKRELMEFKPNQRSEYSQLLKAIYEYASNKTTGYELVIGNIMRRVLEAFGTFEYRKGLCEISYDQTILSIIGEEQRDYFENLMYRLVLNGESHFEDRVKSLTDDNFFATVTSDEKKRAARDVLCLLYLLNRNHVKAQFSALKDEIDANAVENIEGWLSAISTSQTTEVRI